MQTHGAVPWSYSSGIEASRTRCSRRVRLASRPKHGTDVVTGFHKTIDKGGYESIHGGATLSVMGVLIEKRACLGVI